MLYGPNFVYIIILYKNNWFLRQTLFAQQALQIHFYTTGTKCQTGT